MVRRNRLTIRGPDSPALWRQRWRQRPESPEISKLFHLVLTTIQNEGPKALFGSVIPTSQYCWKLWKDRKGETKKKLLRVKIRDLAQFRPVALPDAPEAAIIKSDADKEYSEAIAELAEISALSSKNRIQRWFL